MNRFHFEDFASELDVHNLNLGCFENHMHEALIVNTYCADLYLAWTVEASFHYSLVSNWRTNISNLENFLLHRQRSLVSSLLVWALRKLTKYKFVIDRFYPISFNVKSPKINRTRVFKESLELTWKILSAQSFDVVANMSYHARSIYSTLATMSGTVEFGIRRNSLRILFLAFAYQDSFERMKTIIAKDSPCLVITGNGRLVKAAGIVAAARESNIPVHIIERGAFPGTFEIYQISPHSISERRAHLKSLRQKFGDSESKRIALEYIELRKQFDPISGIQWQAHFEKGKIPIIRSKKICVCFTSTETEFAVFGDEIKVEDFRNQEEAFRTLAEELDPEEWQVIIRRHPYRKVGKRIDPERKLWEKISQLRHVLIVQPDENIDSYALVESASLVAHFNSSMGPEAISMQSAPVITMGPTIWEDENSIYSTTSKVKLEKFIQQKPGIRPESDIYNWGLYWATFGYKFRFVDWRDNKGYFNGKRII